jgi:hypothetical protein
MGRRDKCPVWAMMSPAALAMSSSLVSREGIGRCLPFSQPLTVLKVTPISRKSV